MLSGALTCLRWQASGTAWLTRELAQRGSGWISRGWFSSTAGPANVLLIHQRSQPPAAVEEALRLVQTYNRGRPCEAIPVGSAQLSGSGAIAPATFLRAGSVDAVKERCSAGDANRVVVNHVLSGVQQRNLEAAWGMPVLDRVGLIIEIFAQRAKSREARLQVEMAALEYRASRLVRATDAKTGRRTGFGERGASEVVSARERGRSGGASGGLGGGGGSGESELNLQRQRIGSRRKALQRKLAEVRRTRRIQRVQRQRSGKPTVAVLGYTNAGKTSLVAALTNGAVDDGEDRLFDTLDTVLRRLWLPSGRQVVMSDTVGFISDLPTQLFDAFKGTLEEAIEADLLLHVIDAAAPDVANQRATVYRVLRELGVSDGQLRSRVIEVWNKADLLEASDASKPAPSVGQAAAPSSEQPQEGGDLPSDHANELEEPRASANVQTAGRGLQHSSPSEGTGSVRLSATQASADQHGDREPNADILQPGAAAGGQHNAHADAGDVGLCAASVSTSALDGAGLDELLGLLDRKLALKLGTQELSDHTNYLGPRLLSRSLFTPDRRTKLHR